MIIGPDGFTGAVMAVESVPGAAVLMHGPGGCRVRTSLLSMSLVPREDRRWGEYGEPYYSGYSRVPASYIDGEDYIGGAVRKLEDALEYVRRGGYRLIAVIDSPGASLMADNHMAAIRDLGVSDGTIVLEIPIMSAPVRRTYGRTLAEVIRQIDPAPGRRLGTVLLIGLTVMDASWQDAKDELSSYLEDMGLEVLCAPGAGASVEELAESVKAEFAVAVCPESCDGLSDLYRSMGVTVFLPQEAPVGFDATERWIRGAATVMGRDPSRALEKLGFRRRRFDSKIDGMRYGMMRVAGMTFSASGPGSVLRPLDGWLKTGLSMVPRSMVDEEVDGFRGSKLMPADLVISDGNTALRAESGKRCVASVSTGYAVIGSDGIMPRPLFGAAGAESIMDTIVKASRGR